MSPRYRRMLVAWNAVAPGLGSLMVARKRIRRRGAEEAKRVSGEAKREEDPIPVQGELING